MRACVLLAAAAAAAAASAQPAGPLPPLVRLKQLPPRPHALVLPKGARGGPALPGLAQGATPQGIAYWAKQDWFLVSSYFEQDGHPSVVVALDAKTGKMVRCLTLVGDDGAAHAGHVGGLAVSEKYLWVGSGGLYRAPLAAVAAAREFDHLRLGPPFKAACTASFAAYHDRHVWVGEFVSVEDGVKGVKGHELTDRNGVTKYAWAAGYALTDDDDLAGGKHPAPAAVFGIRQKVQGMAFLDGRVVLSASYGRKNDSTLAGYKNPLPAEAKRPHAKAKVGDATVPVWFLDGKNKEWEVDDFPPMSEGITAYGKRLALVCESGAAQYQKGGRGPLDSVIDLTPPGG